MLFNFVKPFSYRFCNASLHRSQWITHFPFSSIFFFRFYISITLFPNYFCHKFFQYFIHSVIVVRVVILTGVGVGNFIDFIGIQPDLLFAAAHNRGCQPLLKFQGTVKNTRFLIKIHCFFIKAQFNYVLQVHFEQIEYVLNVLFHKNHKNSYLMVSTCNRRFSERQEKLLNGNSSHFRKFFHQSSNSICQNDWTVLYLQMWQCCICMFMQL